MSKSFRIEWCSENTRDIIIHHSKVDQIEFCKDLDKDGLTPAIDDVEQLLLNCATKIKVMIRCRAGNFEFNGEELKLMKNQASAMKALGINNFVFGATKNSRLDLEMISDFCNFVFPSNVCIHKAIDVSDNILADLSLLSQINNVNEILSSGGKRTALEGKDILKQMILKSRPGLNIISAGKITYENIEQIHDLIEGQIYHGKNIININA